MCSPSSRAFKASRLGKEGGLYQGSYRKAWEWSGRHYGPQDVCLFMKATSNPVGFSVQARSSRTEMAMASFFGSLSIESPWTVVGAWSPIVTWPPVVTWREASESRQGQAVTPGSKTLKILWLLWQPEIGWKLYFFLSMTACTYLLSFLSLCTCKHTGTCLEVWFFFSVWTSFYYVWLVFFNRTSKLWTAKLLHPLPGWL